MYLFGELAESKFAPGVYICGRSTPHIPVKKTECRLLDGYLCGRPPTAVISATCTLPLPPDVESASLETSVHIKNSLCFFIPPHIFQKIPCEHEVPWPWFRKIVIGPHEAMVPLPIVFLLFEGRLSAALKRRIFRYGMPIGASSRLHLPPYRFQ